MGMSTMQTKFEIFTFYSYGEIDVQKVIIKKEISTKMLTQVHSH